MSDERLSRLLRSLEADEDPNPAFADALFNELHGGVTAPRHQGRTWLLLAAAVLLASLTAGAAFGSGIVRLPWLVADASLTPQPESSATTSTIPTPEPTTSPSPIATPRTGPALALNSIVRIIATDIDLREEPGLDGQRIGGLAGDGTQAFVVAGPVELDGYDWYQLAALGLPPNSGCLEPPPDALDECPSWLGWVAGTDDGEVVLKATQLNCPSSPMNMSDLAPGDGDIERLACYGDGSITVRAWWPELPDDAGLGGACASGPPSGWLYCQNINYNTLVIDENEGFGGLGLKVSIDPASDITMPARGQWLEVVGHYDDPAARGCDENAALNGDVEEDPDRVVLVCRTQLVVESVSAVDGPF